MKINANDINRMVYEGVKKVILENVDVLQLAREQKPEDLQVFFNAFVDAFGEKGREAINSLGYKGMQRVYDEATPEERQAFEERLNDIDFELSPDVQQSLEETVARVVKRKLNEVSYKPDAKDTLQQIENFEQGYKQWYEKLREIKNEVWAKTDGRNTAELDHCFWAMRIMGSAEQILNGYAMLLKQTGQPLA